MPKLTYTPRLPDDPESTSAHGVQFEKGKAVEVSETVAAALKENPWFNKAVEPPPPNPAVGEVRPDSSIDVRYPPGVGMKTTPDVVQTTEGMVPAGSPPATQAHQQALDRAAGKQPPKK